MANARELKKRHKSVTNTGKITRTMELVASAKLKKATAAANAARPFAEGLVAMMSTLQAACEEGVEHPLMQNRPVQRVALLVATSDRGLCGAFNGNIVRLALRRHRELTAAGCTVTVIALAKKAASVLRFMGLPVDRHMSGLIEKPTYAEAAEVLQPLMTKFEAEAFDAVEMVYSHFESKARQYPDRLTLLPAGGVAADAAAGPEREYIFHPDAEQLLAALVPQAVKTVFFSGLLQTAASEHSARRIAMKNATDAAKDLAKAINSKYNSVRQAKITQEIAEIVGAVEAMK